MKRKVLLVDDEVAVLLTLKAVLEISGFEVDTAASAKDARLRLKNREYTMVITDMRMEHDVAGAEVIRAAREAEYHPAIALLTAFPVAEEDWQELETDKVEVLMKPMHTRVLLQQIEALLTAHDAKLASSNDVASAKSPSVMKPTSTTASATKAIAGKDAKKSPANKAAKSPRTR